MITPIIKINSQTQNICITFTQRWPNVFDVGPTLYKCYTNVIKNYRPISILPSISKIFEKKISNQINDYFNLNNLFHSGHYGFRKHHSTELAAMELIDRTTQDMDRGETPFGIFLDFSKSFDTLNHTILLNKLNHYGIKHCPLKLLK